MGWKTTLAASAVVSVAAFAAQAGVVLSDNFDTGTFTGNWTGDSDFSSPSSYAPYGGGSNASTDHVGPGFYGNLCQGGVGGCVDLDGSSGTGNDPAGVLESKTSFGLASYTLTFDLAGNERGAAAQTTDIYLGGTLEESIGPLASTAAWTPYSFTFTGSGNLTFVEVGPSDQQGNVLDNVTLTSSVPEPATWALMLVGFGALGGAVRGRRGKAIAAI